MIDGSAARQKRILPHLPPAAHDVVPAIEHLDHLRDIARIVLEIAVGGDDDAAARVVEPGGKRRRLAEVAPEPDDAQMRIERLQPRQDREALVRAAVVDDQQLVRASPCRQRLGELPVELDERRRFVANRNDDAQLGGHEGTGHDTGFVESFIGVCALHFGPDEIPGRRPPPEGRSRPSPPRTRAPPRRPAPARRTRRPECRARDSATRGR